MRKFVILLGTALVTMTLAIAVPARDEPQDFARDKPSVPAKNVVSEPAKYLVPKQARDILTEFAKYESPKHARDELPEHAKIESSKHARKVLPEHAKIKTLKHARDVLLKTARDKLPKHIRDVLPKPARNKSPESDRNVPSELDLEGARMPINVNDFLKPTNCENTWNDDDCEEWALLGYCTFTMTDHVPEICMKSCNLCRLVVPQAKSTNCENTWNDDDCEEWALLGYCTFTMTDHVPEICKKSCNLCHICGGEYTSSSGNITHTSDGGNYQNNENCIWVIRSSYPITITFDSFETESSYDYLEIRDGESSGSNLLDTFSGARSPSPVKTTGNAAYLLFTSDQNVVTTGFTIHWDASDPCLHHDCHANSNCYFDVHKREPSCICNNGYYEDPLTEKCHWCLNDYHCSDKETCLEHKCSYEKYPAYNLQKPFLSDDVIQKPIHW